MKIWYILLKLAPAVMLLGGLADAVMEGLTLWWMPQEFREILPANGAFVLLPAMVKAIFVICGAAAVYWLGKLVDTLIPAARG